MAKYTVQWAITGETEIEADSQEAAEIAFQQKDIRDLAETGELEVLTLHDHERAWTDFIAANKPQLYADVGTEQGSPDRGDAA